MNGITLLKVSRCHWHTIVMAVAISVGLSTSGLAVADAEGLIVSPIIATPSGEIHHGKLVWVDLITTDPQKAVDFYVAVFNWRANYFADENYIELSHDGRLLSSVVRYEDGEAEDGDARWLVSISVDDIDAATQRAANNGGEILEAATDLPDRGRYSVIRDSQGAVFMLLRASGGDPVDDTQALDEWAWAELWTDDPDDAVKFYQAIAGYDALDFPDASGDDRIVLGTDGKARATIVPLPWDDVEPNWIAYIPVANVADTVQRIIAAGGGLLLKSDDTDRSAAVAIVVDPTGGVFAIRQAEFGQ
jgi:predicted enzyme related to lactoylglutathione lyase